MTLTGKMVEILNNLANVPDHLRAGAVAIGNFDGVHRGHEVLIRQLVDLAQHFDGPAIVVTFDPPPIAILAPHIQLSLPLTTIDRRAQLLGGLGVDAVVVLKTTPQLLSLSPEEFFKQTVVGDLSANAMVEGPNFCFGRDRTGNTETLKALCEDHKIELRIVEAKKEDRGEMISSTRIRARLADGDIDAVNQMLMQPYQLNGIVEQGSQRGRTIGFPTANIADIQSLIPAHGVYAARIEYEGRWIPSAVNIGPNPTFHEQASKLEAHLIGWAGDLYGRQITCQLLSHLRDVKRFDSVEELKRQIERDISDCLAAQ